MIDTRMKLLPSRHHSPQKHDAYRALNQPVKKHEDSLSMPTNSSTFLKSVSISTMNFTARQVGVIMNISNCYVYENGRQCQRIVAVTRAAQVGCTATTVRASGSEKTRVCLDFSA